MSQEAHLIVDRLRECTRNLSLRSLSISPLPCPPSPPAAVQKFKNARRCGARYFNGVVRCWKALLPPAHTRTSTELRRRPERLPCGEANSCRFSGCAFGAGACLAAETLLRRRSTPSSPPPFLPLQPPPSPPPTLQQMRVRGPRGGHVNPHSSNLHHDSLKTLSLHAEVFFDFFHGSIILKHQNLTFLFPSRRVQVRGGPHAGDFR
jgi:hypothetical protein